MSVIRDMNVIDMILIDHRFLKEALEALGSDHTDKQLKLSICRSFLARLLGHLEAQKVVLYPELKPLEEFHFNVLEALADLAVIEKKSTALKAKISEARTLKVDTEAELKFLCDLVKRYIFEQDAAFLPKMNVELPEETLVQLGHGFMKARELTIVDLIDYPRIDDEAMDWKDELQRLSSQLLAKQEVFDENLRH